MQLLSVVLAALLSMSLVVGWWSHVAFFCQGVDDYCSAGVRDVAGEGLIARAISLLADPAVRAQVSKGKHVIKATKIGHLDAEIFLDIGPQPNEYLLTVKLINNALERKVLLVYDAADDSLRRS